MADARELLTRVLQRAYSGELAATYAYEGHRDSVKAPAERDEIERIRMDEVKHRLRVGGMLAELGSGPDPWRERRLAFIGRAIGLLCHIGGWFIPMYGAGKLERQNIVEYQHAAQHARDAGVGHFVDELLTMAEIEWDHELYFRTKAASSFWWRILPRWARWAPPPPRGSIRDEAA